MASFPEKLRDALAWRRMSQQVFADEVGCSQSLVQKWLKEDAKPDYQQVHAISRVIGCTVDYLCDDEKGIATQEEIERTKLVQETLSMLTAREVLRRLIGKKP